MKSLYFDTNIFIYLSTKTSPLYKKVNELTKYCKNKNIAIFTSTETIQEIIHYGKVFLQLPLSIKIALKTLVLIDNLIPADRELIQKYIELVKTYLNFTKIESRDFIHITSSILYKVDHVITYDKGFKKFKEITSLTPEEYLQKFED